MADAAQEFLDKQLSKNKFTIKQQERLDANGGSAVVDASDGVIPGGGAYAKYGEMPDSDSSTGSGSSSSSGGGGRRGIAVGGDLDHYGNMYEQGKWAKGSLDVEALASKYNLDRSQKDAPNNRDVDAGHIWGKDASGGDVYIGKANMDIGSNADLIKAHSTQLYDDEVVHNNDGSSLDNFGDIQGALLAEWDGGNGEAKKERTPIEHSPEIKQAKKRVQAYEDNIMSGKTSENLFGDYYGDTGLELNDAVSNKSNDQAEAATNYGEAGVGTSSDAKPATETATTSFLSSKKSDLKDKMKFTPKN